MRGAPVLDEPTGLPRGVAPWIHAVVAGVAMLVVAFGLRFGAAPVVRAAVVYAAPSSRSATRHVWRLVWPIVVLEDGAGVRAPIAGLDVVVSARVSARADAGQAEWRGTTNEDGVAEAILAFERPPAGDTITVEVRSGDALLASGRAAIQPPARTPTVGLEPALPWMPFAQRTGPIALDVAVPSGRAAPGFATPVWVRAREVAGPSRGARIADVVVEAEQDPSVASAVVRSPTDAEGWAEIDVTPVGLAVALHLTAKDPNGRAGEWTGGLTMSPGAPSLAVRDRFSPEESPVIDVEWPTARTAGYLEIDDAYGRAWATASLAARITVPPLAPGLYWVVASGDPGGAASFGPGSIARPFAVATSDEAALGYGADREECSVPGDPRLPARRVASCLAVTPLVPAPRWVALDGFVQARARDGTKRLYGLTIAVGAVLTAMALEIALLLRAVLHAGRGLRTASVVAGVLVAALGFLLLAAFLLRVA